MFKFIHAADIHLDSPLKGLEQYEGAPVQEIRDAARRALARLVDLAIEQGVAFVVLAGDLYDGDWRDYNTGLYFVKQATRLREASIPIYMISGNHDAANRMTRSLRMPDNVTLLSNELPQTVTLAELDVAIHGQSYATAATYADLSASYPMAQRGCFNIGLLHTCATGREGHEPYAPCSLEGLRAKSYDYWALGHIHFRETLCEEPFIAFSGNVQGRHIRETGPKGCLLVTVSDEGTVHAEFRPLDVLRWEVARIDISDALVTDDVLSQVIGSIAQLHTAADGRPLAVRIDVHGHSRVHRELLSKSHHWTNEIRSLAIDVGKGDVWIEKVKINSCEPRQDSRTRNLPDGAIGELTSLFEQAMSNPTVLADMGLDLTDVVKKLPAELKSLAPFDNPEWMRQVIAEAESRLLGRLLQPETSE